MIPFMEAHPWWTLAYLIVVCFTVMEVSEQISKAFRRQP